MGDGGRRRTARLGAAVVVALLVAAGVGFALTRSGDARSRRGGPHGPAAALQQTGVDACRAAGCDARTCAGRESGASVGPAAATARCEVYGQMVDAGATLALVTHPAVGRARLI